MAYEYVFRKYKLKRKASSWYEAKLIWSEQLQEKPAETWFLDEFPVREKAKGWLHGVLKQIAG